MMKTVRLLILPLVTIVALLPTRPSLAQNLPQAAESIESMLLGNKRPASAVQNSQPAPTPSKKLEEFKSLAKEEPGQNRGAKVIANIKPEVLPQGTNGAQIYRKYSRSVVLVVSQDMLGSGVLINESGDIVTHWHVVKHNPEAFVFFKPLTEGRQLKKSDLIRARVTKVDDVADLALLRLDRLPADVAPLPMGNSNDVMVGADVHAIGHPTGEGWSYTKGVVSQIWQAYSWRSLGEHGQHKANVIQTQTPINPGNSGGPLISDTGYLVGINSFKSEGEGLNFAVAIDELKHFLSTPGSRKAVAPPVVAEAVATKKSCQSKNLYDGPSSDRTMNKRGIDIDCDGKAEIEERIPYDATKPITAVGDNNKDGKVDEVVVDIDRDGKWDYSLHDTDFDGKWDLIGFHPDGKITGSRFEHYREGWEFSRQPLTESRE